MSKADVFYATQKLAWHRDRIGSIRNQDPVTPIEIQFILSDLCNQDCHFCAYRASAGLSSELFVERKGDEVNRNPNRMIPHDKAEEIIRDASTLGVRSIIFTGGGEPTVHPNHLELMALAQSLGIKTALNTNGVLLRDGWEEVYKRMTYIRISVDAGTPEEYASIRGSTKDTYAKVLDNIAKISRVCEPHTTVGVGYVVTPENYVNLLMGVCNLKKTGVGYVRLACMQSEDGKDAYSEDSWLGASEAASDVAEMLSTDEFSVVNLFDSVIGRRPDYPECHFQKVVLYIGGDLNIYRCCYTAYTELGRTSSLKDRSLIDWFEDDAVHEDYRAFDARSCATCPLNAKNEVLNYLAGEPAHVDFV